MHPIANWREERFMRKVCLILLVAGLVPVLAGPGFAWQGRMGGMGDPYGLVDDESDFLVLPSRIAEDRGVRYYGDARFLLRDVRDLNWSARQSGPIRVSGTELRGFHLAGDWSASGSSWDYGTLVGAAFPAGAGRLGVFFDYRGQTGDFDGKQGLFAGFPGTGNRLAASSAFDMEAGTDDFNLRVVYGQAVGGELSIGGEIQVAHRREENRYRNVLSGLTVNDAVLDIGVALQNDFLGELYPFMKPFDSTSWEVLFKGGMEGRLGPARVGMDVHGGPVFGGDNTLDHAGVVSAGALALENAFRLKGDVSGWQAGGDIWVRYPCSDTVSLPFSLRVNYREKTRDGRGAGDFAIRIDPSIATHSMGWEYGHTETNLDIEAGGGIDVQVSRDLEVASGLYYSFIRGRERLDFAAMPGIVVFDDPVVIGLSDDPFPRTTQHLVKLKVAAERKLGSSRLRGGITAFGGRVSEEYAFSLGAPSLFGVTLLSGGGSLEGSTWGIMGAFGAGMQFQGCTVEPFIQAGYQAFSLDGDGRTRALDALIVVPWALEKNRNEALVGAGVSVAF